MQLRDYQQEAVDSTLNYLSVAKGNPVIAMPTGTGKSLVIAGFIKQMMHMWPTRRAIMLTHVKELVEQNAAKLERMAPEIPLGVYSAGLKRRDTHMSVIFGSAASVRNCVEAFGHRDILFIDECHLLSPRSASTYQSIIAELKEVNPYLRVVGLSATPFRLGQGMLTDDGLFTDICCDMTGVEAFNRFITEGYLAPLVPRRTKTELDVSAVTTSNGDFAKGALQAAVNKKDVTQRALEEMCTHAADRQSWLIFASGNEHAEDVAEMLNSFGVASAAVHSGMPNKERDRRIAMYKEGELRCVVNNNILTTGFDHPPLDFIGMLRPTMSPGLWVQMLGRGTRPSPETGKQDCLVLDFAGNTKRLGPINDPVIPRKKGKGGGDAPVKICESCGTYNHTKVRFCTFCGEEFEFATKIVTQASTQELVRENTPVIEKFKVDQVFYYPHNKVGSPPQIRVSYQCENGLHLFNEFVQLELTNFRGKWSRDWWRKRFPGDYVPKTTEEALHAITQLKVPHTISVHVNRPHPEIKGYEFYG